MKITTVGVDLAKNVFQVHGIDEAGKIIVRKTLRRRQMIPFFSKLEPCLIGVEACGTSHHWARELQRRGYRVKLLAPQWVKPYVKSNKNDMRDAEGICEAMSRPTMRFVPVKSVTQQDIQAVHRVRSGLVRQRTAKANQIRGLVAEYGLVAPTRLGHLRRAIPCWLEDAQNGLSLQFRRLLDGLWGDLVELERRVGELDEELQALAQSDPVAQRLQQLRGVGPVTATALAAMLGTGKAFGNGREFAASLGLTPRQHSSGGKARLLGISKRGDPYLRKLLVHGARAVIRHAKDRDDRLSRWVMALVVRRHTNVATVALANKTERLAWAMVRYETDYVPRLTAGQTGACTAAV